MMPSVILGGCSPEPLSAYLKALGVFRLVSEQVDASAAGCWNGGRFHLRSDAGEADLVRFFMEQYRPTPIVAPWNGGSGFYENDKKDGLDAIAKSMAARFDDYRATINAIKGFPEMPRSGLTAEDLLRIYGEDTKKKRGQAQASQQKVITDAESTLSLISAALDEPNLRALDYDQIATAIQSKEISVPLSAVKKLRNAVSKLNRSGGKEKIVLACRGRLDDRAVEWIDTAVLLGDEGTLLYPPLAGAGGGEGRLDYTNTFMSLLKDLFVDPPPDSPAMGLLKASLFGVPTSGLVITSFGQYNPGRAGGYNMGPGVEHKDFTINPWDFILSLEGIVAWAAGVSRRLGSTAKGVLVSPFTVRTRAVGYFSSSRTDPGKARAEVWVPLWNRPATYPEIRHLLGEGRAEVAGRSSRNAVEFAEAASSLGVDRGIAGFVRYNLLRRRGDSYVALPAGEFAVHERREAELVRDLDRVLHPLDGFLYRFPNHEPPAQLASARRNIDEAVFALLERGGSGLVRTLLINIGRMERLLSIRDLSKDPKLSAPLGGLHPEWLLKSDDGSVEIRIAAALAAMQRTAGVGPLRANLTPIDPMAPWKWADRGKQVAWAGPSLPARMVDALTRRIVDADKLGAKQNPLFSLLQLHEDDIAAFICGPVDDNLVEDLLFGFSWVKWHDTPAVKAVSRSLSWSKAAASGALVPRDWALLKLLFLSGPLVWPPGKETAVKPEPSIIPLLIAGQLGRACAVAQRRLFSAGLNPIKTTFPESIQGLRTAAALLLPVRRPDRLARLVLETPTSS